MSIDVFNKNVLSINIGGQNFEYIRKNKNFYIDKSLFIRDFWDNGDDIFLVTRPRRFGKTLNLSMLYCFFSVEYENRGDLFEGLYIWDIEEFRELQGKFPVIRLSFSTFTGLDFNSAKMKIYQQIIELYNSFSFILDSGKYDKNEIVEYSKIGYNENLKDGDITQSIRLLSEYLFRYYEKKPIILIDEYDTPIQEAYLSGYLEDMLFFMKILLHETLKANDFLEKALLIGITRVSENSIFSGLNNVCVVGITSNIFSSFFGFTYDEVSYALSECGLSDKIEEVKTWYDGYIFGNTKGIYNPWSIMNYIKNRKLDLYWAKTASYELLSNLINESSLEFKDSFSRLLNGDSITVFIDEYIVYSQLGNNPDNLWSLLVSTGYLSITDYNVTGSTLVVPNKEVLTNLSRMVLDWFNYKGTNYCKYFSQALLQNDVSSMNKYIQYISSCVFSNIEVGGNGEIFYHGFMLGLVANLSNDYIITSNRESGYGRYDLVLEPRKKTLDSIAIIMEFKKADSKKDLQEYVQDAINQIETKNYEKDLIHRGMSRDRIYKYGVAFHKKSILIDGGDYMYISSIYNR